MIDNQKFESLAHKAKVLFEYNIPYEVMSQVLGLGLGTIAHYKSKVELKYNIQLHPNHSKKGLYGEMLMLVITGLNFTNQTEREEQQALLAAAKIIVQLDKIKSAIEGAVSMFQLMKKPIVDDLGVYFINDLRLAERILNISILDPWNDPRLSSAEKNPWDLCLKEMAAGKINLRLLNSNEETIKCLLSEVILKNLDRRQIVSSKFDKRAFHDCLENALSQLVTREAKVLGHSFNLMGKEYLSQKEMSQKYEVSQQYISLLKERAIRHLRKSDSASELLSFFSDCERDHFKNARIESLAKENKLLQSRLEGAAVPGFPFTKEELVILKKDFYDFDISVRAYNALNLAKVKTVAELVALKPGELSQFRNIGQKTIYELTELVEKLNFHFGMIDKATAQRIVAMEEPK